MYTKRVCFHLLFILIFIFNFVATVGPVGVAPASAKPEPMSRPAALADMTGWVYHLGLNVHNNASTPLPTGFTLDYALDTASLIAQNQLQPDCDDLRVTYGVVPADTELDRLVEGCNSASTTIRFRAQADIPVGGDDMNYHLYYGNDLAGAAPADPRNVFAYYDDFQDGDANGWNAAKGAWSVVDDGGNFIYRYTSGGANWAISYVTLPRRVQSGLPRQGAGSGKHNLDRPGVPHPGCQQFPDLLRKPRCGCVQVCTYCQRQSLEFSRSPYSQWEPIPGIPYESKQWEVSCGHASGR